MNQVYFGNHAYGIEAAAQTYFSKHAKELTLMQAALLAGLPQAPSLYDPVLHPRGRARAPRRVFEALYGNGDISYDRSRPRSATEPPPEPGRLYPRIREPYFFCSSATS